MTKLYVARPDSVRGQEPRIRDHMPTIRFEDGGRELAIITLTGRKSGERSQEEWAKLFAAAPDMKSEIIRNIQFLYELRGLFEVMKLNETVHKVGLEMHIEAQEKILKKASGEK